MGKYLSLKYEVSEDLSLLTEDITTQCGLPKVAFTHAGIDVVRSSVERSGKQKEHRYEHVILLSCDIKDTMVSAYFQATKRSSAFEGTMSKFVETEQFGVSKLLVFYNTWLRTRKEITSFLFIRYEDLRRDPEETLIKVLTFIGEVDVDEHLLKQSIEYCSLNNFRKLEADGRFNIHRLRAKDLEDVESYKTRKGRVGGYKDYLSEEDQTCIDKAIESSQFSFEEFM